MAFLTLAGALAGVTLTWALLYGSLLGFGLAGRRWMAGRGVPNGERGAHALSDAFWLGYAIVLLALQLWHLALPVSTAATILMVGGGLAALYAQRHAGLEAAREVWR